MHDAQVEAALERLVPRASGEAGRDAQGWKDVQRRARRLRFRRRSLLAATALCTALFSTLAAAGQIGSFASHSKAPHLLARATLYTQEGGRVGSLEIELERATIAFGRRVRVMRWRLPSDRGFRARWFLELDRLPGASLRSGSLVVGGAPQPLCAPCGGRASGELELSPAEATALVNDEAVFAGTRAHGAVVSGAVRLDRSHLQRGVMCAKSAKACTRIYTGRP
jgi:hypothetical protein